MGFAGTRFRATQVVGGNPCWQRSDQALAERLRGAHLVTFEKPGHAVYVDGRDKFNVELLAFVK